MPQLPLSFSTGELPAQTQRESCGFASRIERQHDVEVGTGSIILPTAAGTPHGGVNVVSLVVVLWKQLVTSSAELFGNNKHNFPLCNSPTDPLSLISITATNRLFLLSQHIHKNAAAMSVKTVQTQPFQGTHTLHLHMLLRKKPLDAN